MGPLTAFQRPHGGGPPAAAIGGKLAGGRCIHGEETQEDHISVDDGQKGHKLWYTGPFTFLFRVPLDPDPHGDPIQILEISDDFGCGIPGGGRLEDKTQFGLLWGN